MTTVQSVPVGRGARSVFGAADRLQHAARDLLSEHALARTAVREALEPITEELARTDLHDIPVGRLKEATGGRLRIDALEQGGLTSIGQVLDASAYQLRSLPGIGNHTAVQITAAANQFLTAAQDSVTVRIDVEDRNPQTTALVVALRKLVGAGADLSRACSAGRRLDDELSVLLAGARPARGRLRMLVAGREKRLRAREAVGELTELVEDAARTETLLLLTQATTDLLRTSTADEAWIDFELSAPEYYSLLAETIALEPDPDASRGFVPDKLADRVNAQRLDETHRRVSLRGYQAFGARFALAQRRVIIGDEMGLGKGIEAIAVLAHLRAEGHTHFVVACPASVLVNWIRELERRSTLAAYRLHGADRADATTEWLAVGGVAVTTLDSLHRLETPEKVQVAALVVDEAHFVKNPATRRSKAVARWCQATERVIFLTGTPMENHLADFRNLVGYLQPELSDRIGPDTDRPEGFRKAVAPVYLRRNQKDVLTELPGLVLMDEWTEFTATDWDGYREAVASGSFMAIRSAGYLAAEKSAKLQRILEILEDAAEHSLKVVVFSYFLDVLATVHESVGPAAFGPITGSVSPTRRQDLVDEFSAVAGHAVLLGQIQAAGVGLNLQAASVVVLCEPQIKPSLESQAIARAHRMGQVRTVRAHRILSTDSVDQRILDILKRKDHLFDSYVRRSDLAESAPEAVDISEAQLARTIVEEEQLRAASSR